MKRKLIYTLIVITLIGFTAIGTENLRRHSQIIKLKEIQLQDTSVKLKNLNQEYEQLLQESQIDDKKLKELEEQKKELEIQLQAKLQKQEEERLALQNRSKLIKTAYAASLPVSGSCAEWIAAAGITDVGNATELIRRESGCNPNAVNKSSGACGVAQELPCGKSGCSMGDGACQVKWMNNYVHGRYGSWGAAVAFHNSHNWY